MCPHTLAESNSSTMSDKIIRIKDIAEKARVSTGTVDRVIHNRGNVAVEVRERVLQIIEDLDYQPNMIARALGANKIHTLAALIPDPSFDAYWLAPKAGIEKAEKEVGQYGIRVQKFLFNSYQPDSFVKKAVEVTASNPAGILLAPIFYREALPFFEEWNKKNIPFILFNTQIEDYSPLSFIGQDSYQSGLLAGKLVSYGQSAPCTVLVAHFDEEISNSAHLQKKEEGFRDYFKINKLTKEFKIIRAELSTANTSSFRKLFIELVRANPKLAAIYVTTSKAFKIAELLEEEQAGHIKLIGYDLIPQNIKYLQKSVINFLINQNPEGQGYWGISQLTDHLVFKKRVAPVKFLPLDIVTSENLQYFSG